MANRAEKWKDLPCKRQGVYQVKLRDNTCTIAEWRSADSKQPARWQHYPADRPDVEGRMPVSLTGVVQFCPASASDIAAFILKKETQQTLADQLQTLYDKYRLSSFADMTYTPPIPAHRQLQPGDDVELGHLKDVKVVELRRNGQDVIVSYHDKKKIYGREVDNGTAYKVTHWTRVVPVAARFPTEFAQKPWLVDSYRQSAVSSLLFKITGGLDDCPDYQRGYVWTVEDKKRYLASVFEGRDLGRFIFVKRPFPNHDQILDGKQRLNCLHEFFTSQFEYQGFFWHQLSSRDRAHFENRAVQFAELPEALDRETLLRIFLDVNAAGVPQNDEHLDKVRRLLALERARKYLVTFPPQSKVADLYDEDPLLHSVLTNAFEGFEYPDYSHLTMAQVLKRIARAVDESSPG